MMWWNSDGSWGHGWWWPGLIVMAVFMIICMVMMARMMSHGMSRSHHANPRHPGHDAPERTLANRLASGEIDIDEYERLSDALQRAADSTPSIIWKDR
jgi:uncharacterized membrane protein